VCKCNAPLYSVTSEYCNTVILWRKNVNLYQYQIRVLIFPLKFNTFGSTSNFQLQIIRFFKILYKSQFMSDFVFVFNKNRIKWSFRKGGKLTCITTWQKTLPATPPSTPHYQVHSKQIKLAPHSLIHSNASEITIQ
jgi:hypothetical protein